MKKPLAFFFLLLFLSNDGFSQNRKVMNQLWQEFHSASTDTARIRRLASLSSNHFANFNLDSARILNEEVRRSSQKIDFPEGMVRYFLNSGFIENRKLNIERAIELTDSALVLARKFPKVGLTGACLGNLGGNFQKKGDFKTALRYLSEARDIALKDNNQNLLWAVTTNLAATYGNMNLISEGVKFSAEALEIARKKKNTAQQVQNVMSLFDGYSSLHDQQNTRKWSTVLDSLSQITNNPMHYYFANRAKGLVAYHSGEYENAKIYQEKSLEFAKQTGNINFVIGSKALLIDAYLELNELEKAEPLVLELREQMKNVKVAFKEKLSVTFGQEALVKLKKGDQMGAEQALKTMEELADSSGNFLALRPVYFALSRMFINEKKDFENGYKFYLKSAVLQDSIFSSEKIREAAGLELRYTFEKEKSEQDKKLLQLENQNLSSELQIREQQAALFRGKSEAENREILVRLLNEEKSKQHLLIENQSFALDQQQLLTRSQADSLALLGKENEILSKDRKLQAAAIFRERVGLAAAVFGAFLLAIGAYFLNRRRQQRHLERLRLDIARDLHDEIGSSIGSIALFGKSLQKMLGDARPDATSGLQKITQNAETSLESLRDIVWTIDSRHDTVEDFSARAHEFVLPACSAAEVHGEVRAELAEPAARLHPNLKKNLWLFLKEAVANALRYSETEKLEVVLNFQKKEIRLEIRDFGLGFDPKSARSGGNGLKNMELRAREVGGKFEIKTAVGQGTAVILTCPARGE